MVRYGLMSSQPRVSIIIVSWNGRELLERCLRSLARHVTTAHEVIVVDNFSIDGTVASITKNFPLVKLIANQSNRGFSAANNQGLAIATGEVVCFLNADTEVQSDPFPLLITELTTSPRCGAVAPRLLNTDGSIQSSTRRFPRWPDQVITVLKLRHLFRRSSVMRRYRDGRAETANEPLSVDEAMGAALLLSRPALADVVGWDEGYWIWFEDVDMCQRLHRAGWDVRYVPAATVLHHGGTSFQQVVSLRKQWWFLRSLWRYTRQYWSPIAAGSLALLYPISYALTVIQSLLKPR